MDPLAGDAVPATAETDAFEPEALPGRHGHGTAALDLLRRLYPAEHPVLRLSGDAEPPAATVSTVTAADLEESAHLLPALADAWNAASPYGLPWLVARLRAPGGCPWDREQDHLTLRQVPARGGLRGLRRARGRLDAGPCRGARRPAAPDRAARPVRRRGRRLRPGRRPARHLRQDRAAPPARLRRRDGEHVRRGDPQLGAHQGRRARHGRARHTQRSRHARRLRRPLEVAAGARLRPGDAGARGRPRL